MLPVNFPGYISRHSLIQSNFDHHHFFRSDLNVHVDFFIVGAHELNGQHQGIAVRETDIRGIKNKVGYQDFGGLLGLVQLLYQQLQ